MRLLWLPLLLSFGCGAGETQEDPDSQDVKGPDGSSKNDPPEGACGVVETFDVAVTGRVLVDGAPAAGAEVVVEDRYWEPGVLGTGTTDGQGYFDVDAQGVHAVEDCWVYLDYVVTAAHGNRSQETSVTQEMKQTWDAGAGAGLSIGSIELD